MATIPSTRHLFQGYGQPPLPVPLPPLTIPPPQPDREIREIPSRSPDLPYDSPFGEIDGLQGWRVETLCFQAAKPRRNAQGVKSKRDGDLINFDNVKKVTKEEAAAYSMDIRRKVRENFKNSERASAQMDRQGWSEKSQEQETLFIAVNRYFKDGARQKTPGGVTIVTTHGNGFTKEMWEPVLGRVIAEDPRIEEVWSMENPACGDSAILNEGYLGHLVGDYVDQANDIVQFLLYYLGPSASSLALSPDQPYSTRRAKSFKPFLLPVQSPSRSRSKPQRRIALVGHSMGAGALISAIGSLFGHAASASYPGLHDLPVKVWHAVIVDPAMQHPYRVENLEKQTAPPGTQAWKVPGAIRTAYIRQVRIRRGKWGSREEAVQGLGRLVQRWEEGAQRRYMGTALWEGADGQTDGAVELKCRPALEALHFAQESSHPWQSLALFPSGPGSPRILLILPDPAATMTTPDVMDDLLDRLREPIRSGAMTVKRFMKEGHLIVYEKPDLIAKEILGVLKQGETVEEEVQAKL